MNATQRFIFQALLWFSIWGSLWVYSGVEPIFIEANGLAFVFQIVLLAGLVFYAAPKFIFQKKYFTFIITSIVVLFICAYASSELISPPIENIPPLEGRRPIEGRALAEARQNLMRQRHGQTPTKFFVHLLMISISFILATLIETFVFIQKKEKGIALAKSELKEAELKFLKMQINPHFLFNALNNIYALSVTNSDKTQEAISTLSLMLRYVLYDCERPEVPIRRELEYITNFIRLFKLKSSKDFNISFTEDVQDDMAMVAPMIFIPFIENAFKHSGIEKGGDSFVNISLKSSGESIDFVVENSIPQKQLTKDKHGGIGLKNVQKRLNILYPDKHKLTINTTATFKVYLQVTRG